MACALLAIATVVLAFRRIGIIEPTLRAARLGT
jgi:hypothetical protein